MENRTDFEMQTESSSQPFNTTLASTSSQPFNTTLASTSSQPFNNTSASISSPFKSTNSSNIIDIIAASDMISGANYVYGFCLFLGLASACFLLFDFVQSFRACRSLTWLDSLLWAFSGFQLLLLLLSLSSVAHRPNYLESTQLGCAALAFTVNMASLCGLFLLVLMGYTLTYDPPTHRLMKRGVLVALVILVSVLCSFVLAVLRDSPQSLGSTGSCIIHPTKAGRSYAMVKLCLGVLIPYIFLLGLLTGSGIRQWKSSSRFLSGSKYGPVFLAVSLETFVCQLFHGIALVRGAELNQVEGISPYERVFMDVSEFVMFSSSCVCLVLVLLLHRPSRESFLEVMRHFRDCCRGLEGRQTHRHIMAPQIEIADTLSYDF